jgi:Fe2+ transport system protein FeoA
MTRSKAAPVMYAVTAAAPHDPMMTLPATTPSTEVRLSDVRLREVVELVRLDLPEEAATPLMERGVLPGCRIRPTRHTPFGDPVIIVDGTVLALRREVARCLCVRRREGS